MGRSARLITAAVAAAVACGCAASSSDQTAADVAYRRGQLSYADKQQLTRNQNEQQLAAQQAAIQRDQQQPLSNPSYKKLVYPQPTEDPMRAGRPIDEQ